MSDGTVVVGLSGTTAGNRAFRWVEGGTQGVGVNPQMQDLGTLPDGTFSLASAVSDDGLVVVGQSGPSSSYQTDGNRAFRWAEDTGMENLGVLSGDQWSFARGVNDDGSIVVGQSGIGSSARAFIWRGQMEDYANLITSFPVLANDSAVVVAEQQTFTSQLMRQPHLASAGQAIMSAEMGRRNTGRNPNSVGQRDTTLGSLSYGWGLSENLTFGATLGLDQTSLNNSEFDVDTGIGLASWLQYSEGGSNRTGVQLAAAVGYTRTTAEISRGRLLVDVLPAAGSARIDTRSAQAEIGYGFELGSWLVTPSLGLAHFDTRRSAYREEGAQFNATYEELQMDRTVATLSIAGELDVSENGRLMLELGVDRELTTEQPRLTGSSDIPGLETFDIVGGFIPNRTRTFAKIGYAYDIGNGASLSGSVQLGEAVYGTSNTIGEGLSPSFR